MRRAKRGKLEAVWSYMRRNRAFCVEKLMVATGIDKSYLKSFLWHLENASYIKRQNDKPFEKRCYYLIKDTGAKCPKAANGEVYDYNLKKSVVFSSKLKQILSNLLLGIEAEEALKEYFGDSLMIADIKCEIRAAKKIDRVDVLERIERSLLNERDMDK